MATRFWVGGTGTWNASNTDNWSATSGGATGASVPTSSDTVTFDASSGGGVVTVATDFNVTSVTMGAFTGTLDFATNNNNPTMQTFDCSGTGVRTLNMGNGIWHLTTTGTIWTTATTTNLTLNKGNAIIAVMNTSATGKTITGGNKNLYKLFYVGTPASLTLTNVTFDYVVIDNITQTARKTFQDELNRLNGTSYLSIRDCLKSLAGGDQNRSTNQLANAYAATTNQTTQWAMNVKAGRNPNNVGILTKQDATKLV